MKLANKIAKLNSMEEQLNKRSALLTALIKAFPDHRGQDHLWARTGTISEKQYGLLIGLSQRDPARFKKIAADIFKIN